jgi:thymidylate kinase
VRTLAGKLIVFEGADGVGKTTIVQALVELLRERGIKVERFAFPGAEPTTVGRLVYDVHHRPESYGICAITPASLQALHVAAHVDAIQGRILPALWSEACVLLDRYWWSTWVYGRVARVPAAVLRPLIQFERRVWGATRPAMIFHLVRPESGNSEIEVEYARLAAREQSRVPVTRIETSGIEGTRDAVLAELLSLSRDARAPRPQA